MCSPLVADPYFSAQAAMTHSPSKLALQIGVLRQRRANCDAVSVPRLHHIDRVYRIALEGAGYHTTDSSVHIAASGAGRSAAPSSRRRSGIHLHDVAGDRRAACTGAAAPPGSSPARSRGGGISPIHRCPRCSQDHARTIWIGFGAVIAIFLINRGDRWAGQRQR
jgi:hypothetical protein